MLNLAYRKINRNFVRPTSLRSFSTCHLDVGAKKYIGVYGPPSMHLQQASDCISEHFDFLALGFLGFC
jgi:hypothetical protein